MPKEDTVSKEQATNEEERKIPSLDELVALVQQPKIKLWQEKKKRIKIQTPEGRVITIPYDEEVYARLKQARFFVVQGKYDEARKVIRVARALFAEAHDDNGMQQVDKLIDSLARAA